MRINKFKVYLSTVTEEYRSPYALGIELKQQNRVWLMGCIRRQGKLETSTRIT